MTVEIDNKYNIGNVVQTYKDEWVCDKEIICPVCKGNYKVENPNYNYENDEGSEYLICGCCNQGKIKVNTRKEKVITDEKYKITGIWIKVENNNISFSYQLNSTPELNNRTHGYCSKSVTEEEIAIKNK